MNGQGGNWLDIIEDVGEDELGFKDQRRLEKGFETIFSTGEIGCKCNGVISRRSRLENALSNTSVYQVKNI